MGLLLLLFVAAVVVVGRSVGEDRVGRGWKCRFLSLLGWLIKWHVWDSNQESFDQRFMVYPSPARPNRRVKGGTICPRPSPEVAAEKIPIPEVTRKTPFGLHPLCRSLTAFDQSLSGEEIIRFVSVWCKSRSPDWSIRFFWWLNATFLPAF